ncbi:MAG: hypothetical protein ACE5K4_06495 [Candidatus Hydrothermarchaeota archaeon]
MKKLDLSEETIFSMFLILAIVIIIGLAITKMPGEEEFSAYHLDDYPKTTIMSGSNFSFTFTIENHEKKENVYVYSIYLSNNTHSLLLKNESIKVNPNEEAKVEYTGRGYYSGRVDILINGEKLFFWLDVEGG